MCSPSLRVFLVPIFPFFFVLTHLLNVLQQPVDLLVLGPDRLLQLADPPLGPAHAHPYTAPASPGAAKEGAPVVGPPAVGGKTYIFLKKILLLLAALLLRCFACWTFQ